MMNLSLPNGRKLAYTIYGDPEGFPIIYCHGFPASGIEAKLFNDDAVDTGIRLIAPDRPGFGGSDYQDDRRILDWPQDVRYLADHLELECYSVLGNSGGGPYAAACGIAPDPRMYQLGLICALGPMEEPESTRGMGWPARTFITLARSHPALALAIYSNLVGPAMHRFPGSTVSILTSVAPACDKRVFQHAGQRAIYIDSFREAFRQGGKGPAWDLHLFTRPWGFETRDIVTRVYLWHGDADRTVPVEMGHDWEKRIPDCRAQFVTDEGHFSLPDRIMKQVFGVLKRDGST